MSFTAVPVVRKDIVSLRDRGLTHSNSLTLTLGDIIEEDLQPQSQSNTVITRFIFITTRSINATTSNIQHHTITPHDIVIFITSSLPAIAKECISWVLP